MAGRAKAQHDRRELSQQTAKPPTQAARPSAPTHPADALRRLAATRPLTFGRDDILTLQRALGNRAVGRLLTERARPQAARPPARPAAMPAKLRDEMEQAFAADFSRVRVEVDAQSSSELGASAYTRGEVIHFAPGQFQPHSRAGRALVGHELAHVVQQRQGRVRPSAQAAGVPLNDDPRLEREADEMGAAAAAGREVAHATSPGGKVGAPSGAAVQRKVGFEFQTVGTGTGFYQATDKSKKFNEGKVKYYRGPGYSIEADEGDLELVTKPFEETESGYQELRSTLIDMKIFADLIAGTEHSLDFFRHFLWLTPEQVSLENKNNLVLKGDAKIQADPQTTVGIRMDKLLELATALSQAKGRKSAFLKTDVDPFKPNAPERDVSPRYMEYSAQQLADFIGWKEFQIKAFRGMMTNAVADVKQFEGEEITAGMKGFLFLIAAYARGAREYVVRKEGVDVPETPYSAKFALPIMSRTNLADSFLKLPLADRQWFAANHERVAAVLGADAPLFPEKMNWEQFQIAFKIKDWLRYLIPKEGPAAEYPGVDYSSVYEGLGDISNVPFNEMGLKARHFKEPDKFLAAKQASRERYREAGLTESTDIGKATEGGEARLGGTILELRKLGAKLTQKEWLPFASAVFELVVLLNQGPERRNEIMGVNAFKLKYGL